MEKCTASFVEVMSGSCISIQNAVTAKPHLLLKRRAGLT